MKKHILTLSHFTTDINKGATKDDITNGIPLFKAHKEACDCVKCEEKETKSNTWSAQEVTVKELATKLTTGSYFTPVKLNDKNHSKESFVESSVIAFDFDNGDQPADVLKAFQEIGINIAIMYTSASDKPEKRKFRAVTFLSDSFFSADSYEEALHGIYMTLATKYGIKPDWRTLNATHSFYPGRDIIHLDETAETPFYIVSRLKLAVQPVKEMIRMENKIAKDKAEKAEADALGITLEELFVLKGLEKKAARERKRAEREQLIKEGKLDAKTVRKLERSDFNELVEALKEKNEEKCRELMAPKYSHINKDEWNLMTREQKEETVPLSELFGVEMDEKFLCWLPEHADDTSPSSSLKVSRGGQEIYTCFGCGNYIQLHTVVSKLTGLNVREVADFLTKVTGQNWLSMYQVDTVLRITELKRTIFNKGFEEMYPALTKFSNGNLIPLYLFMIDQASQLVPDEALTKEANDITFFMSLGELSRRAVKAGLTGVSCEKQLGKKLKNLSLIGLLSTEREGLREEVLDKAKTLKSAKHVKYEQNFYTVNTSPEVFLKAEAMAVYLKQIGYRKGQTGKVQMDILFGSDIMEEHYKQDKADDLRYKKDEVAFLNIANLLIERKGYAIKADMVEEYIRTNNGKRTQKGAERLFESVRATFDKGEYFLPIIVTKATRAEHNIGADVPNRVKAYVQL